jgi:hypothetical protein
VETHQGRITTTIKAAIKTNIRIDIVLIG